MEIKVILILVVYCIIVVVTEASDINNKIEARGKKKKIGLFIFFADLIVKKIFVLKLIYAFVLWVVIHKAGYFLAWFVTYLKDQKHDHIEHEHVPHHYDYSPPHGHPSYGPPSYGPPSFEPYRRQALRNDFRD